MEAAGPGGPGGGTRQTASGGGQTVQIAGSPSHFTIHQHAVAPVAFPVRFQVPPEVRFFHGREDELSALAAALAPEARVVVTQALGGLGGIGKTTLAARYTRDHVDEYEIVAWVDAEDGGVRDLAKLAARLGIGTDGLSPSECAERARDWLAGSERRWLLVLDNVPDADSLRACCPNAGNGCVLITSRHRAINQVASVLTVDVLDLETATNYLTDRAGRTDDHDAARRLAEALGQLPLALAHAGAYCAAGAGFSDYHALLDLPAHELYDSNREAAYQHTVASTWTISIIAATTRAPLARDVLAMSAYLAPERISPALFDVLLDDPAGPRDRKRLRDALNALHDYSLIDATDASVDVHRLLQKVVRDDAQHRADSAPGAAATSALTRSFPADPALPAGWPVCEELLTHILALTATYAAEAHPRAAISLLNRASFYLFSAADSLRATSTATTALQLGERLLGPEDTDTLTARARLANAYRASGRTTDAITLQEVVLAARKRLLGDEHPDTLTAGADLATSLWSAGRTTEGLPLEEAVLAARERILGADHPDTLALRTDLAVSYLTAGRTADAIKLQEAVLVDKERVLGADHPDTLAARHNLANAYHVAGRTDDSITLQLAVLADCERVLGDEHTATLMARQNLAGAYHWAGRDTEAIPLFEAVIADRERLLLGEHPDMLAALAGLADSYRSAGRVTEAVALFEAVLADSERHYGPEHPDVLTARDNLATAYHSVGRDPDAIPLQAAVLADRERLLGADHLDTLTARDDLARYTWSAGLVAEALDLFQAVLADSERHHGPEHPDTLTARGNVAAAYHETGRIAEAIAMKQAVLADCERLLSVEDPITVATRGSLAASYHSAKRAAAAIRTQREVLADCERLFGADHPDTLTARDDIVVYYWSAGRSTDAIVAQEMVLADRQRLLGAEHPDTLDADADLRAMKRQIGR